MQSDAIKLIKDDHRMLERLFKQLQAGTGDRRTLVDEVTARLTAHSRAEEQEVYPAIREADPAEGAEVDHAYHEHWEAEHLLGKVRNLIGSPHFDEALTQFVSAVKHHVKEEESQVLPALKNAVDRETLLRLGDAFAKARRNELALVGFAPPTKANLTTTGPSAESTDLDTATRDELYEMAKKADIPRRSTMTKDELSQALQEQGRDPSRTIYI
jgi:hemerythrin superfamily protein